MVAFVVVALLVAAVVALDFAVFLFVLSLCGCVNDSHPSLLKVLE